MQLSHKHSSRRLKVGPIVQKVWSTSKMILCADDLDIATWSDISQKLFWLAMYHRNISTFTGTGARPVPFSSNLISWYYMLGWWLWTAVQKCCHPCLVSPPTQFQDALLFWLQYSGYLYPKYYLLSQYHLLCVFCYYYYQLLFYQAL